MSSLPKMMVGRRRLLAGGFAVVAILTPVIVATSVDTITAQAALLWSAFALLCLLLAVAAFEWSEGESLRRRIAQWEPAVQQMRGASLRLETMQRRLSDIDANASEIMALRHVVNEERHNLSLVASGMVEIRTLIDGERENLGSVAHGVHEVRASVDRLGEQAQNVFGEVHQFAEIVRALRTHLDALSGMVDSLDIRVAGEQRNLGLVADGLDTIRRAAAGVERFDARQSAFEDALVAISDRVDTLDTSSATKSAA